MEAWYWLPLLFIYAGVIITILVENRNPSKSLAYILAILFLPGVGLLIYILFGRNFKKQKRFNRKGISDRAALKEIWRENKSYFEESLDYLDDKIGDLTYPFRLLYNQRLSSLSDNNEVKLLINGEEKFPDLFQSIREAKHHIHIEYYIFTDDALGRSLTELLIAKAGEGVVIRVIVDDLGSDDIGDLPGMMKEAGIEFIPFLPVRYNSLAQTNYRNHRKIIVIDGITGYTGGINIDARYRNDGSNELYWRDTSVKITGTAVNILQLQFMLSLSFCGRQTFPFAEPYFHSNEKRYGNAVVAIAASGPDSEYPVCMETIISAINQAKHSIRITNPYFLPSDQIISALQIAASSGVTVELIIPGVSDSYFVQHASYSYLKPLLKRGVHVYQYNKGFVHAKTFLFDKSLAYVGTVNMDTRSFYINFEIMALIQDDALCDRLYRAFDDDLEFCNRLTYRDWLKRGVVTRMIDSICRLIAPIL